MEAFRIQQAMAIVRDEVKTMPGKFIRADRRAFRGELLSPAGQKELLEAINDGSYRVAPGFPFTIKKRDGSPRPSLSLRLNDRIYYTASVLECLQAIVRPGSGPRFQGYAGKIERLATGGLETFDRVSQLKEFLGFGSAPAPAEGKILRADIAGFYPAIRHEVLQTALLNLGVGEEKISNILDSLKTWMAGAPAGLPQTFWASDMLAEAVLRPVDQALHSAGIVHSRISDNYRLYADDEATCLQQALVLQDLLHTRGFQLNESKTRITSPSVKEHGRRFRLFTGFFSGSRH